MGPLLQRSGSQAFHRGLEAGDCPQQGNGWDLWLHPECFGPLGQPDVVL